MTEVNDPATGTDAPVSADPAAPAAPEKPVDPAALALALKKEKERQAVRAATDAFAAALRAWRTESGSPDAVTDSAVAWMVANGLADLSDVPSTMKPTFGMFERAHRDLLVTARGKALGILVPVTQRELPHGVPDTGAATPTEASD